MILGVVGRPRIDKDIDCQILLERVCKLEKITRKTTHQDFSDDIFINTKIKNRK